MKKLRVVDSLKFVRAIFVAVAVAFILNVAHADTTAIQSVIAYGKTEQSGTPTPTAPVPIMTNNGVLSVTPSLLRMPTYEEWSKANLLPGVGYRNIPIQLEPNTTYHLSTTFLNDYTPVGKSMHVLLTNNPINNDGRWLAIAHKEASTGGKRDGNMTTGDDGLLYMRISNGTSKANYNELLANTRIQLVKGDSAKPSIYANGLTETIRDAAGHKATTQMLLSVSGQRDEQNITTGAITRRVGVKVLDGTESWDRVFVYGNVKNVVIAPLSSIAPDAKILKNKIWCSHFRTYDGGAFTGNTAGIDWASTYYNSTPSVGIQVPGITTSVADFKAWLAEQYAAGTPVIVVYPLATETPEDGVAPQTLTTAPVRQTLGAIMNMPIKTILTDNTEIMSGAEELIKIATTKYNEESFEDVQDALTGVFNAVDTVVTQTMNQAQEIDTIATTKQTRPNADCPVGKNCLLVEDENGNPNWYVIAGADEANPTNP